MDWRSSPQCTELMPPMDDFSNSLLGTAPPLLIALPSLGLNEAPGLSQRSARVTSYP
jgi:hypothetical protein